MTKRRISLIALVILVLTLTACGGTSKPSSTTPTTLYSASGFVKNEFGYGIPDVAISFGGDDFEQVTTSSLSKLNWISERELRGEVTVTPIAEGWAFEPQSITLSPSELPSGSHFSDVDFVGYIDREPYDVKDDVVWFPKTIHNTKDDEGTLYEYEYVIAVCRYPRPIHPFCFSDDDITRTSKRFTLESLGTGLYRLIDGKEPYIQVEHCGKIPVFHVEGSVCGAPYVGQSNLNAWNRYQYNHYEGDVEVWNMNFDYEPSNLPDEIKGGILWSGRIRLYEKQKSISISRSLTRLSPDN